MLQQTTVKAVIPFYENFLRLFPDLPSLAQAPLSAVLSAWSGLGYYTRARNLHKAAQQFQALGGIPKTAEVLKNFPGFGPYTSRAVSSLSFNEDVGVLDGNVIRVLSRLSANSREWWTLGVRHQLQKLSDDLIGSGVQKSVEPAILNQALMELGASICTPQKPSCLLCPVRKHCLALRESKVDQIPKMRPRPQKEFWVWQPEVRVQAQKVGVLKQHFGPFLKNQKIFPGKLEKMSTKPKKFDFKHTITRYEIYVQVDSTPKISPKDSRIQMVPIHELTSHSPSKVLQKVLNTYFQKAKGAK